MSPRPLALVTGASAGIGAAFARELAARGRNLVLVARRRERLEALGAELARAHGARCTVIEADLARPEAIESIARALDAQSLAVDVLVNNAGYGVPGTLAKVPWPVHRDFFEVLMVAPVALTHRLLPGMLERGRGLVVNVASLAGLVPASAGHTLYGASKSFLIKFSQSVALETAPRGVKVCAVCPGFTFSEFHDVNGTRGMVSRMPAWMWQDADAVVREGLDAAQRGESSWVTGRANRAIAWLMRHLPPKLAQGMVARRARDFRKLD